MAVKSSNEVGKPTIFEQPAINAKEQKEKETINKMTLMQKLNKVRLGVLGSVSKSGKNNFQKYDYFELKDFVPQALKECDKYGITALYSVGETTARLQIVDSETGEDIVFSTPWVMSVGSNNPIQNLGATHTYTRRYLWMMALEIVEADQVDGQDQTKIKKPTTSVPKATEEQIGILHQLYNAQEIQSMLQSKGLSSINEFTAVDAMKAINFRKPQGVEANA